MSVSVGGGSPVWGMPCPFVFREGVSCRWGAGHEGPHEPSWSEEDVTAAWERVWAAASGRGDPARVMPRAWFDEGVQVGLRLSVREEPVLADRCPARFAGEQCVGPRGHDGDHHGPHVAVWSEPQEIGPLSGRACGNRVLRAKMSDYGGVRVCRLPHGHDGLHEDDEMRWSADARLPEPGLPLETITAGRRFTLGPRMIQACGVCGAGVVDHPDVLERHRAWHEGNVA